MRETKALDSCRNEERGYLNGERKRPLRFHFPLNLSFIRGVIYLWVGRGHKAREHFEAVT